MFFTNLGVIAITLALFEFGYELVAIIIAWLYTYTLLLQTRMMVALLVSGTIAALIVPQVTDELTVSLSLYVVGLLAASVVGAHLVAFAISFITGFRI